MSWIFIAYVHVSSVEFRFHSGDIYPVELDVCNADKDVVLHLTCSHQLYEPSGI
jgi:hypothetical protein